MTDLHRVGIAWDPGVTSGYCIFDTAPFNVRSCGIVRWADLPQTSWALIEGLASDGALAVVVVEVFILYKHKARDQIGSDFPSSQGVGLLRAWAWRAGVRLATQPASIMERVEILPEHAPLLVFPELSTSEAEHPKDAYKHARWWAAREARRKRQER